MVTPTVTSTPTPTITPLFAEDFSGYTEGQQISSDWTNLDGTAITNTIEEDTKALYLDGTRGTAVYAGAGSSAWTSYRVSLRFLVTDAIAAFGILFRVQTGAQPGQCNYQLTLSNGTCMLAKNSSTQTGTYSITESSGAVTYTANVFNDIVVEVNGAHFQAFMNGSSTPFLDYTDPGTTYEAIITSGTIGFGRYSSYLYIDDIVVTPL